MRSFLHVARVEDWEIAQARGEYDVPAGPDAFIYARVPDQLPGVLQRFHASTPRETLVLLEVDPAGLSVEVEAAEDGAGAFPHVYGAIPVASVAAARPVP